MSGPALRHSPSVDTPLNGNSEVLSSGARSKRQAVASTSHKREGGWVGMVLVTPRGVMEELQSHEPTVEERKAGTHRHAFCPREESASHMFLLVSKEALRLSWVGIADHPQCHRVACERERLPHLLAFCCRRHASSKRVLPVERSSHTREQLPSVVASGQKLT